jgi:hypothetical protein
MVDILEKVHTEIEKSINIIATTKTSTESIINDSSGKEAHKIVFILLRALISTFRAKSTHRFICEIYKRT